MRSGVIAWALAQGRHYAMGGALRGVRASESGKIAVPAQAIGPRRPAGAEDRVVVGRGGAVVASRGAAAAAHGKRCRTAVVRYSAAMAVEAISSTYVSSRTMTNPRAR